MALPSENTATVVYSHCTDRFQHHTVAVFSLGGATAVMKFLNKKVNDCVQHIHTAEVHQFPRNSVMEFS